jgi:hypothetical protein
MDFAKFVDLIENQSLWFSSVAKLREVDPLEGTLNDAQWKNLQSFYQGTVDPGRTGIEGYLKAQQKIRNTMYVSCWRSGEKESLAMWDLYGKGNGIVAIKSSVGLLKNELAACNGPVRIAQVSYDWSSPQWSANPFHLNARKDESYDHEAEVRALIWWKECKNWGSLIKRRSTSGLSLQIDIHKLITEVIVGPREPSWIAKLVKKVMEKYNLSQPLTVSNKLTERKHIGLRLGVIETGYTKPLF